MPRDIRTLRPVLPDGGAPASEAAADAGRELGAARGFWRAMTWRSRLLAGTALIALAGGGAWGLAQQPVGAWAEVAHEPAGGAPAPPATATGPLAVAHPVSAPPRVDRSSTQSARPRSAAEFASPAAPGAGMPSPMPMAAVDAPAEPGAHGDAEDAGAEPGVAAAPDTDTAPNPAAPPPPAAVRAPSATAADPAMAEIKRLAAEAAARRPTALQPAAPDPERARLAAMVTELSAITKQVLERQIQTDRGAEAAQAAVAKRLADIEQRLTFAEARAAVSATVAAAAAPVAAQLAAAARPPSPRAPVVGPQSYRVTAASPGMALLAVQNPMPGQQAVLEVRTDCAGVQPPACHEEVPGLGKVRRIGQRGTLWEVQTPGGTIER